MKRIVLGLVAAWAALAGWADEPPTYGTISMAVPTFVWVRTTNDLTITIPVRFSQATTERRTVRWQANDGTAKLGTDFTQSNGERVTAGNTITSTEFEIYLKPNTGDRSIKSFTVTLTGGDGVTVNESAATTTIYLLDGGDLAYADSVESDRTPAARLENRDWSTLAASLVNGVAVKAADGESAAEAWDTTAEKNGWQTLTDGEANRNVVVQNDERYEIVGGRLTGDTVWESNKVYVVRNWVYVPSGCTLTIMTNTVVKFCEQTGISGSVVVKGAEDQPVVWTSAKDDTIGGDTDLKADTPAWGDYNVASVSDTGLAIRYATLSGWGTASVTPLVVGAVSAGVVRVPVTISASRSTPFFVNWRLSDGSQSGQMRWANSGEGMKFVELDAEKVRGDDGGDAVATQRGKGADGTVSIELYESQGINVSTGAMKGRVVVYRDAALQTFEDAAVEAVASARLENRDWDTVGAALVNGTVMKSADGESTAVAWDTRSEANGWQTLRDGEIARNVVVQNDEKYEIVGGRLAGDTVWSADRVYIVRNWMYVPSGATLTIGANTVVKFCEQTGISGNVVVAASASEPAVLTVVADDAVGGNADCRVATPVEGTFSLSGSFSHVGCLLKYATASGFPVVSVPSVVAGSKGSGVVRVPVSVSGSRTGEFAVNWIATDLGAKYGEDYAKRSGRIVWNSTSEGTKFVEIPLDAKGATEADERFVFTLTDGTDLTVSKTENAATVDLYDSDRMNDGQYLGLVISDASPYASFKTPVFGTDEDGGAYRQALQNWLVEKGKMAQPSVGADVAAVVAAVRSAGEDRSVKGVPLWEEFVAGTNPDDETSKFTARISFDEEGKPEVTWSPALNDESPLEGGSTRQGVRRYRVFGKNELTTAEKWTECPEGAEGDYRFFKVSVDMP